jgi:maleylacetoacetate isomerase
MSEKFTLYHYWRSSASWRVRWGLALKKIPHEKVAVDLLSFEEKQAEYLRRNPAGYVPCLVAGSRPPLGESLAILEWLEESYPTPSFFAGDSFLRAKIRQLAETVNAGIQPLQNLDVMRRVSDDKDRQAEWARHWNERGLGVFESILSTIDRRACRFSVADHPTLADLCLIPQVYSALRFKLDMSAFPQCKAIYEHALGTPECAESRPEAVQPPAKP